MQLQPLPTDRLLFVGLQSVLRSEVSVSKANAIPYNRVRAPGSARVAAENRVRVHRRAALGQRSARFAAIRKPSVIQHL